LPQTIPDTRPVCNANSRDHQQLDLRDSEEDPLGQGAIRAPLKDMLSAMASVGTKGNACKRQSGLILDDPTGRVRKRMKPDLTNRAGPFRGQLSKWSKGSYTCQHVDPITAGIVSESEAQRLFELWVFFDFLEGPSSSFQILRQVPYIHASL
jgi:hypothetical protein